MEYCRTGIATVAVANPLIYMRASLSRPRRGSFRHAVRAIHQLGANRCTSRTSPPCAFRIREAKQGDIEAIAELSAEAFGRGQWGDGTENPWLTALENRYTEVIRKEVKAKLSEVMDRKIQVLCEPMTH